MVLHEQPNANYYVLRNRLDSIKADRFLTTEGREPTRSGYVHMTFRIAPESAGGRHARGQPDRVDFGFVVNAPTMRMVPAALRYLDRPSSLGLREALR